MIKGGKINLRVVRESDLETLFDFVSDIENRGHFFPIYLTSEAKFRQEFEETGFWERDKGQLLIVDEEDMILGSIVFIRSIPYFDALEIGYIVFDQASRNQGIMTEALSLFARFLFETKKVNRLHLTVIVGNAASKRVAEKCGFKFEGVARQAIFHRGKNLDLEWYALLREEFGF